jgi:hypothetical protein
MKAYGPAPLRGLFDGTNLPTVTYKEIGGSSATARKLKIVEVDFETGGEEEEQTDPNGTVNGLLHKKPRDIMTLGLIVQADTTANARTAIIPPIPFQQIVLANFVAASFAFLNGNWAYTLGAKVKGAEGEDEDWKLTIPLKVFYKPDGTVVPLTGAGGILVAAA